MNFLLAAGSQGQEEEMDIIWPQTSEDREITALYHSSAPAVWEKLIPPLCCLWLQFSMKTCGHVTAISEQRLLQSSCSQHSSIQKMSAVSHLVMIPKRKNDSAQYIHVKLCFFLLSVNPIEWSCCCLFYKMSFGNLLSDLLHCNTCILFILIIIDPLYQTKSYKRFLIWLWLLIFRLRPWGYWCYKCIFARSYCVKPNLCKKNHLLTNHCTVCVITTHMQIMCKVVFSLFT